MRNFSQHHAYPESLLLHTLGDFKSAALLHITEKAVRFMRAHLAQAIVDASPMTSKECMRLVENSLDFDHALSLSFLPSLTVCAVLYDARTVHAQWVEADHHFFTAYICDTCKDDVALYSFRHSFCSASEGSFASDPRPPPPSQDTAKCFNGVFDSLYILSLGETAQCQCSVHKSVLSHTILSYYIPPHCTSVCPFLSYLCVFLGPAVHFFSSLPLC
jgi:hypothetical protein